MYALIVWGLELCCVIFVGLQVLRIMRRRVSRKTLINTAFFGVLLCAIIGGINKDANTIQKIGMNSNVQSDAEDTRTVGDRVSKKKKMTKPQCTGDGKTPAQRETGCLCGPIGKSRVCPASANNIYCFFEKCFAIPQCEKSTTEPVKHECICRNIETHDICKIGSFCSYAMNKCYEISMTGTENYGIEQKGIEFPGDRIKDYTYHRGVPTNGYNYVHKMYDTEFKNDSYCNKNYLFDERNNYRLFKTQNEVDNIHDFRTRQLGQLLDAGYNYIWVLSPSYELYISKWPVHHNHFLNGGPVLAAGGLEIQDGFTKEDDIVIWDNASGHYKPCFQCVKHILEYFKKQGMTDEDMKNWQCKNRAYTRGKEEKLCNKIQW